MMRSSARSTDRIRRRLVVVAGALGLALLAPACRDNCRTLAERVCSFYEGGGFEPGAVRTCLDQVDVTFQKFSQGSGVAWENEYRCSEYLKTCTREALERGEAYQCGLSTAGPFSPCYSVWHDACDCTESPIADFRERCHATAATGRFTAEEDLACGLGRAGACDCSALAAGECDKCGFSACGPFSPCVNRWLTACECIWKGLPEQLEECSAIGRDGISSLPEWNPFIVRGPEAYTFYSDWDARCGAALDTCTCDAVATGNCEACGFTTPFCGYFSSCSALWRRSCGCLDSPVPDAQERCLTAVRTTAFTPSQDAVCGRDGRMDSCTCEALAAGECEKCGFSPCGPFSPCLDTWRTACECVWGEFPGQLAACIAVAEGGATSIPELNPFTERDESVYTFPGAWDARCGASRETCNCEAANSGDCTKCGFPAEFCYYFSSCKAMSYRICDCSAASEPGAAVCRKYSDRGGIFAYDPETEAQCGALRAICDCTALDDADRCPRFALFGYTPCRVLTYELCGCPDVPEDAQTDCVNKVIYPEGATPGFTGEEEAECGAMKDTCNCGSLTTGQGCPAFLLTRRGG